MSLLGILIYVLIACVVIWGTKALLAAFSIGDPIRTVILVVVMILVLLVVLGQLQLVPLRIG